MRLCKAREILGRYSIMIGKYITISMTALVFMISGTGLAQGFAHSQNSPSVPPEIAEFYEDYNFVASFSTPAERDILIDHFSTDALPDDLCSNRMNRVFRLMKKLYSKITRIDPEMVVHVGPKKSAIKYFFNAELLDIKKVDRSGKKAVVEISSYSLEPEFVSRYIKQYEAVQDGEEEVPSEEERIEFLKNHITPKTEFHIWLYQNGSWSKAEYKNIYIKR